MQDKIKFKRLSMTWIQRSKLEFRELWLVSAVITVGEILWLVGFEFTQNLICVNTSVKMLEKFLALLVLHQTNHAVVVSTLNQHSLIWHACKLVVNLFLSINLLCNLKIRISQSQFFISGFLASPASTCCFVECSLFIYFIILPACFHCSW